MVWNSEARRLIAATIGAIFMKLGRAPATLMILSMFRVSGFKFQVPARQLKTLNSKLETFLQPNYPRPAFAPHVSIQCVACINNQRRQLCNVWIIDLAVIGDDHQAIRGPDLIIR